MPGVPIPVRMILAPIEIIGVISKPFALMMRLFANITAGHIIVLSLVSLIFVFGNAGESLPMSGAGAAVAVPFTLFISLIELLVAFLQAFLFTMLTSVFLGMAMAEHHHEEAH
jgi:F-type H+-transporting ATPase subunit a